MGYQVIWSEAAVEDRPRRWSQRHPASGLERCQIFGQLLSFDGALPGAVAQFGLGRSLLIR